MKPCTRVGIITLLWQNNSNLEAGTQTGRCCCFSLSVCRSQKYARKYCCVGGDIFDLVLCDQSLFRS